MKNLKIIGVIICSLFLMAMSCEEDDEMDDREEVDVLLRLTTFESDCNDESVTYVIETDDVQRSFTVGVQMFDETRFSVRDGEFINIKAFFTNDPNNLELAEVNILVNPSSDATGELFAVDAWYVNCQSPRILWDYN